jgi:polyisoprenyl-phosphate glycosyltransferase
MRGERVSALEVPLVSVVCPVFCEEDCLHEFHSRLVKALRSIEPAVRYEIVYVNNGSHDSSPTILRGFCSVDRSVHLVDLSRNFGHQMSITAGVDHASGDAVVVIDSDLQDPPEVIVEMVSHWREGWKVVYGVRTARQGESRLKLATAHAFYWVIDRLSETPLPRNSGDFRLMDRQVVEALNGLRERNRYVRGLVAWVGFRQYPLEYERDPRHSGESKYRFRHLTRFAVDAITSFSEKPLRIALQLGAVTTLLALAAAIWIVFGKLTDPSSAIPGFASLMVVVLFFGGVQLISVGLLGEYVGRTYIESKDRPLYVVADLVNFSDEAAQ